MTAHDMSFGTPARSCPGKHLAWVVMSKTLATLFRDFEVKALNELNGPPGPGGSSWIVRSTFVSRVIGAEVAFIPRKK